MIRLALLLVTLTVKTGSFEIVLVSVAVFSETGAKTVLVNQIPLPKIRPIRIKNAHFHQLIIDQLIDFCLRCRFFSVTLITPNLSLWLLVSSSIV